MHQHGNGYIYIPGRPMMTPDISQRVTAGCITVTCRLQLVQRSASLSLSPAGDAVDEPLLHGRWRFCCSVANFSRSVWRRASRSRAYFCSLSRYLRISVSLISSTTLSSLSEAISMSSSVSRGLAYCAAEQCPVTCNPSCSGPELVDGDEHRLELQPSRHFIPS